VAAAPDGLMGSYHFGAPAVQAPSATRFKGSMVGPLHPPPEVGCPLHPKFFEPPTSKQPKRHCTVAIGTARGCARASRVLKRGSPGAFSAWTTVPALRQCCLHAAIREVSASAVSSRVQQPELAQGVPTFFFLDFPRPVTPTLNLSTLRIDSCAIVVHFPPICFFLRVSLLLHCSPSSLLYFITRWQVSLLPDLTSIIPV
jgi:hypothetical protein